MVMPDDILTFWFSDRVKPSWWRKDPALDEEIRQKFMKTYEMAVKGELRSWEQAAKGTLALLILLDQFSRNMFRGDPRAFGADEQALAVAKAAITKGFDRQTSPQQRHFFYMPFMHSEQLAEQKKGIELFRVLEGPDGVDYAIQHRDIIARFGRFPHRNAVLARESTVEEKEFLKTHAGF